jgi:hypothetical protein
LVIWGLEGIKKLCHRIEGRDKPWRICIRFGYLRIPDIPERILNPGRYVFKSLKVSSTLYEYLLPRLTYFNPEATFTSNTIDTGYPLLSLPPQCTVPELSAQLNALPINPLSYAAKMLLITAYVPPTHTNAPSAIKNQ